MDEADNIIIDSVRYAGTPDFYELIFKRIPDDALYTEDDMHKYKSMLVTNAHKHKYYLQSIIEQQGIQAETRNRANDVDHIQKTEEEIERDYLIQ